MRAEECVIVEKALIQNFYDILGDQNAARNFAEAYFSHDFSWKGPRPFSICHGGAAYFETFWLPFTQAFGGLVRETHIFMGGRSDGKVDGSPDGRYWVCATGYFYADFVGAWLGFAPTGDHVKLRFADCFRFAEGKIAEYHMLIDIIDFLQQIGKNPLPPSKGVDFVYPAPTGVNGILLDEAPPEDTAYSMSLIRQFLFEGLNSFDEKELASMGVAQFFHPNVKWYGPGGIGACLSLREFEDYHQRPWLTAYPDRKVQDLGCLICDGVFSGGSGFAGVRAHHTGTYLDAPATNKMVTINGMDFWLRKGDKFVENWVFVDMIDLFEQFGIDLLQKAKAI